MEVFETSYRGFGLVYNDNKDKSGWLVYDPNREYVDCYINIHEARKAIDKSFGTKFKPFVAMTGFGEKVRIVRVSPNRKYVGFVGKRKNPQMLDERGLFEDSQYNRQLLETIDALRKKLTYLDKKILQLRNKLIHVKPYEETV